MIVKEINEGMKIPYEVTGTKICFDDDLTINLSKRQEDWPVQVDILTDSDGSLVIGAASGDFFVAQIAIPEMEYEEIETTETNENGEAVIERTPKDLDMDKVTLTLWALENYA